MQDNQNKSIRLMIGGYELSGWDEATVDNAIDIPADSFSVTLFNPVYDQLPNSISAGQQAQLYYDNQLIMTGIVDRLSEAITRHGRGLQISGRDLVGQLINCSVPIFNGRQISLEELINQYIKKGNLSQLFPQIIIHDDSALKSKISVEPSESLWDALTKAASATGQTIWLDADGTLQIGNPFERPYYVQTSLQLMFDGNQNNVLDAQYDEDVSDVFSQIKILSQDSNANHILAETLTKTPYPFNRLKIVSLGDVDTKAEADVALKKIIGDNNLEAYNLKVTVAGWTVDEKVWSAGWYLNLRSDVLSRATAKWAVMGRTLHLSRSNGQTTELKLKRQGDWVQPIAEKNKTHKKRNRHHKHHRRQAQ